MTRDSARSLKRPPCASRGSGGTQLPGSMMWSVPPSGTPASLESREGQEASPSEGRRPRDGETGSLGSICTEAGVRSASSRENILGVSHRARQSFGPWSRDEESKTPGFSRKRRLVGGKTFPFASHSQTAMWPRKRTSRRSSIHAVMRGCRRRWDRYLREGYFY